MKNKYLGGKQHSWAWVWKPSLAPIFYDWTYFPFIASILWYLLFNVSVTLRPWSFSASTSNRLIQVASLASRHKQITVCAAFFCPNQPLIFTNSLSEWKSLAPADLFQSAFRGELYGEDEQWTRRNRCQVPNAIKSSINSNLALAYELLRRDYTLKRVRDHLARNGIPHSERPYNHFRIKYLPVTFLISIFYRHQKY